MPIDVTIPKSFQGMDWWQTVADALHDGSDELGQLEQFNVSQRVLADAYDTGALLADVSYEVGPGRTLAYIYAANEEQLAEWGREYDIYQEGGLLGLATYTNGPHEMFAQIMTTDIAAIEQWGEKWAQEGLDRLTP
jgi:hypothetical protein